MLDSFTEEEMIEKVFCHLEMIYRYTRENEPDENDRFLYQLMGEYLEMKKAKVNNNEEH